MGTPSSHRLALQAKWQLRLSFLQPHFCNSFGLCLSYNLAAFKLHDFKAQNIREKKTVRDTALMERRISFCFGSERGPCSLATRSNGKDTNFGLRTAGGTGGHPAQSHICVMLSGLQNPQEPQYLVVTEGLTPATLAVKRIPGAPSAVVGNRLSRSVIHSGFSTINSTYLSMTPYKITWTGLGGLP